MYVRVKVRKLVDQREREKLDEVVWRIEREKTKERGRPSSEQQPCEESKGCRKLKRRE